MTRPANSFVRVLGAREHNLRNVSVELPRDCLVVLTGVSGSGKSSLAFGTIYAEAQRRYLESVAPYARRLIEQAGAPDVDDILGLPPAIALQQRRGGGGSRSSVGTISNLSNSLRMLFSRAGTYPGGSARLESDAFSSNTVVGACPNCHGLGVEHTVDEASLVPDPSLTIRQKAIAAWPGAWQGKNLRDILGELGYDIDVPWSSLPQVARDWILFTDEQPQVTVHPIRGAGQIQRDYEGIYMSARRYVLHTFATTQSPSLRRRAARHLLSAPCPVCHGRRLRPDSLAVTFGGHDITFFTSRALSDLNALLQPTAELAHPTATGETSAAAVSLTRDICARSRAIVDLGLGYLSCDRATPTLSAGEMQRLRLGTVLKSGLFGVLYVLDEPSAGLHPVDTEALLVSLNTLREAGNSLLLVEHDLAVVHNADWIVDVGPGAGELGGQVLYSGPVPGLESVPTSATRRYLFESHRRPARAPRPAENWLRLSGVTSHNLNDVDVDFPLGVLVAVTGVSGSGKSTLVSQVLADLVISHLHLQAAPDDEPIDDETVVTEDCASTARATGLELVDRLIQVDQKPIGRTPRSNLATYTGLFDAVRKVFAGTAQARERGYDVGRFSFNVSSGRCPTCQGEGFVSVELMFLPSTYTPCPTCHGARYNPETLEITHRGKTIADVLDMTVRQALEFLGDVPVAVRSLRTLHEVGLGYLRLGQPATGLSGGEAQRIKLATELQRRHRGHTLYLLDEPTTGLHPADVDTLMDELEGLVAAGNSVIVVEHDLDVVTRADWIIDLGPGGGSAGGHIIATGTPTDVARAGVGATAPFLAARLPGL
jgi:excinuclease ABC subunit A